MEVGPVGLVFVLFNEVAEYVDAMPDQVFDVRCCEEQWVLGPQAVGGGQYLLVVYGAWCVCAICELQVTFC